jgi:hypothetical protein
MEIKNRKQIGEIGERIAIGELSKFGLDVLLPMSDNLPFDLVVYRHNKLFRCQVKTSFVMNENGSVTFDLSTNNWYSGGVYKYTKEDYDVLICCDGSDIYLFPIKEVENRKAIVVRMVPTKNNQRNKINYKEECKVSEQRINKIFV